MKKQSPAIINLEQSPIKAIRSSSDCTTELCYLASILTEKEPSAFNNFALFGLIIERVNDRKLHNGFDGLYRDFSDWIRNAVVNGEQIEPELLNRRINVLLSYTKE